jgi:hypothetical protein
VHLYHDLQPYLCLWPDCPQPDTRYRTRKEWEAHLDTHTNTISQFCDLCRDDIMRAPDDWRSHMEVHMLRIAHFSLPRMHFQLPRLTDEEDDTVADFYNADSYPRSISTASEDVSTHEVEGEGPELTVQSLEELVSWQPESKSLTESYLEDDSAGKIHSEKASFELYKAISTRSANYFQSYETGDQDNWRFLKEHEVSVPRKGVLIEVLDSLYIPWRLHEVRATMTLS